MNAERSFRFLILNPEEHEERLEQEERERQEWFNQW